MAVPRAALLVPVHEYVHAAGIAELNLQRCLPEPSGMPIGTTVFSDSRILPLAESLTNTVYGSRRILISRTGAKGV